MSQDLWAARTHYDPIGFGLPYRLLAPPAEAGPGPHPLVVFLHGAGERGDDNQAQLTHGVWRFVQDRERFPCWVVAPQCGRPYRWVEVDWGEPTPHRQPQRPSLPMGALLDLVPRLIAELAVDRQRVWASRISMGGFGTWDLIARRPEWFAAGVPVCGGADDTTAVRLSRIPIWTFHGDADTVVLPQRTRSMVAALRAAGGTPRFSEYPGVGHGSWGPAFEERDLLSWLFAQRR